VNERRPSQRQRQLNLVMPAKAGIQQAQASMFIRRIAKSGGG
jgi:hypothetical protein